MLFFFSPVSALDVYDHRVGVREDSVGIRDMVP